MTQEIQRLPQVEASITAEVDNVLIFVKGVDEFQVHGPGGVDYTQLAEGQAQRFSSALAAMYLDLGPGEHIRQTVETGSGLHPSALSSALKFIQSSLLPKDVAEVFIGKRKGLSEQLIRFGSFAIACQKPTAEDRRRARQRQDQGTESEQEPEQKPVLVPEQEPEPESALAIVYFDHVLITLDSGSFLLSLDSPTALLVARVLGVLGNLPDRQLKRPVGEKPTTEKVWAGMPELEKRLFTNDERRLQGLGKFLIPQTENIMRYLTQALGLTNTVGGRFILMKNHVGTDFRLMPPTQEFLDNSPDLQFIQIQEIPGEGEYSMVRPAFAPPSPDQVTAIMPRAAEVLDYDGPSTYDRALNILEVIMPKEGKEAIRQVLRAGSQGAEVDAEAVVTRLKEEAYRIMDTVGAGDDAIRNRTIAGWNAVMSGHVVVDSRVHLGAMKEITGARSEASAWRRQKVMFKVVKKDS